MDDELDPDEETEYEYDKADRLIEATGDNDQTYVVDANGNLVNHYKWVFSPSPHDYDQENRLIEVKLQSSLYTYFYSYNGDGNRVLTKRKQGSTQAQNQTSYVYDVNQPLPGIIQDTWHPFPSETRKYVWGLGLLYMVEDGYAFFYHQDNLGSVRAVTDENADMDSSFEYEAFGGKVEVDSLSTQPFGFTGEVDDNSFGFVDYMYLRARHYNPFIGRFLSRDSYAGDITRPLSLNRYTYTENNPVNFTDPSGMAKNKVLLDFVYDEDRMACFDAPPEMDFNANMEEAAKNRGNYYWFYQAVKTGGDWDYKQFGNYEPFGNCHYGAAGASMGVSEYVLLNAAGANQFAKNVVRLVERRPLIPSGGFPLLNWPFGDDPADSVRISECARSAPLYCGN